MTHAAGGGGGGGGRMGVAKRNLRGSRLSIFMCLFSKKKKTDVLRHIAVHPPYAILCAPGILCPAF